MRCEGGRRALTTVKETASSRNAPVFELGLVSVEIDVEERGGESSVVAFTVAVVHAARVRSQKGMAARCAG